MIHRTMLVGSGDAWQMKCTCPDRSPLGTRTDAYVWEENHLRNVSRARLRRAPSLLDQRDYFLRMSEDYTVPREERVLWRRLADELTPWVDTPEEDYPPLF